MRFAIGVLVAVGISLPASANTWETSSHVDPFTDAHVAEAYLGSFTPNGGWLGIRCTDGLLEILVYHEYEVLDHDKLVLNRVGSQDPSSQAWIESTTGDALYHPHPDELLRALREDADRKFATRVWTSAGRYLDSVFDLINLDQAVSVISEAGCLP